MAAQGAQVGDVGRSVWVFDDVIVVAYGCSGCACWGDACGVVGRQVALQGGAGVVPVLGCCNQPVGVLGLEVVVDLDGEVGGVVGDEGASSAGVQRAEPEQVGNIAAQDRGRECREWVSGVGQSFAGHDCFGQSFARHGFAEDGGASSFAIWPRVFGWWVVELVAVGRRQAGRLLTWRFDVIARQEQG